MLSLHTQVENLTNLLHARRTERVQRVSRQDAYLNLVAAILDVPVDSVRPSPAYQAAFAPAVATITPQRSRAA
jgi:hypothetical protein